MTDELLVFTGLDQSIPSDNDWALKRIEEILSESVEEHDAYLALDACKFLVQVSKVSGLALAKALYFIKKNWSSYELEDEFEDIAYIYIGLHKYTVERYTATWKMYDEKLIPDKFVERIQRHNVKAQIPIANALKQGFEINENEWNKLANAPDITTVSKIIREDIKGKSPRKGSLQLYIDDLGSVWGYQDSEKEFVGSLEIDSDSDIVQKAIARIKDASGILES
jgi:hypothetical protein